MKYFSKGSTKSFCAFFELKRIINALSKRSGKPTRKCNFNRHFQRPPVYCSYFKLLSIPTLLSYLQSKGRRH